MNSQHKSENPSFFSSTLKFHSTKNKGIPLKKLPSAKDVNQYTSLLLSEYYSLVESISHLEEKDFYSIHSEINSVVDKLIKWFEETSPSNTLSIYWTCQVVGMATLESVPCDQVLKVCRFTEKFSKTPVDGQFWIAENGSLTLVMGTIKLRGIDIVTKIPKSS